MSTEGSETNLISSEDNTISEDLQSSQSIVTEDVKEDFSSGIVAPPSTSAGEALVLEETTSGVVCNSDNQIARESTHSAEANLTKESSDASIGSSANEESGDSDTSSVKTRQKKVRRVSFAEQVGEDCGGTAAPETAAPETSGDLTTPTRATGERESEDGQDSIETDVNYGCCPEHRGVIGYIRIKLMYFRKSKYFLLLLFALLAMPLALGFVGGKYMYLCPASPAVTILFFMMGVIGTVVLCGGIYNGVKKILLPRSGWEDRRGDISIAGLLLLSVLFATESYCFFKMEPEFTSTRSSHKYCDPNFYYFATWMNYSGIALFIVVILLQCPCINPNNVTRITP